MFSLDGDIGLRVSEDLGDLRRALERVNRGDLPESEAIQAAIQRTLRLTDDLADWLMGGRHLQALPDPARTPRTDLGRSAP